MAPLVGLSTARAREQRKSTRPIALCSHGNPRIVNRVMERLEEGAAPLAAVGEGVDVVIAG